MFESDLSRRSFLQLLSAATASLISGEAGWAEEAEPRPQSFAHFRQFPPGAVKPEGWLQLYMQKQAKELGAHLPDVSWPFTAPYWEGETQGESWWPWEQKAYWIDGATRLGLVLNDRDLVVRAGSAIQYTMSHIDADGYIGPAYFKDPSQDFHRWPQALFFRSLEATAEASNGQRKAIAQALQKHYLSDKASYGSPLRNVVNIESILWTYGETGDRRLLSLAEKSWAEYMKLGAADPEHGDLSVLRVEANTPINCHGVTYAEISKLLPILYSYTGDRKYLEFGLASQRRVLTHHMLVDGTPSTSEWFRTTTALDSHETCCISDFTWNWGYYLMATGDGAWADRIERACWNAGPGAIKNDWKALQYFSCPNQVLATLNSDHNVMEHGGHMMAFQPNPGQHTACCGGNVHRFLPNYVIRMWMQTADEGLAATLYGPSVFEATIGSARQTVKIRQTTGYPFEEKILLRFEQADTVKFPLLLRVPSWAVETRVKSNGNSIAAAQATRGFIRIERAFKRGDEIEIEFPAKPALSYWPEAGAAVERGPLVYALPIQAKWSPKVVERYSTEEFPAWDARPDSSWNFALTSSADKIEVVHGSPTDDPWSQPPVSLRVKGKRVDGWELQVNPDNPEQLFTPALPDLSQSTNVNKEESITLVPYGSTQLRLTIFPHTDVGARADGSSIG